MKNFKDKLLICLILILLSSCNINESYIENNDDECNFNTINYMNYVDENNMVLVEDTITGFYSYEHINK